MLSVEKHELKQAKYPVVYVHVHPKFRLRHSSTRLDDTGCAVSMYSSTSATITSRMRGESSPRLEQIADIVSRAPF